MPIMLKNTATSFDNVNLSVWLEGNIEANISVNRLDVEDSTFTIPASVSDSATWYV